MKHQGLYVGLSLLSALAFSALAGCDQDTTTETSSDTDTDANRGASPDPLTGDWKGENCFGSAQKPSEVESCSITLSFSKDLDFSMEAAWVNLAATQEYPGCTTTKRVTGQKWSTDHDKDTIHITGTSHATMERAKCVDPKDEVQTSSTDDISVPAGDYHYSIDGTTLNIDSGPLKGVYAR